VAGREKMIRKVMRQDFPACADIIKKEFDMICEIAGEIIKHNSGR